MLRFNAARRLVQAAAVGGRSPVGAVGADVVLFGRGNPSLQALARRSGWKSDMWVSEGFINRHLQQHPLKATDRPTGVQLSTYVHQRVFHCESVIAATQNATLRGVLNDRLTKGIEEASRLSLNFSQTAAHFALSPIRLHMPKFTAQAVATLDAYCNEHRHQCKHRFWVTEKHLREFVGGAVVPPELDRLGVLVRTNSASFFRNADEFEHPPGVEATPLLVDDRGPRAVISASLSAGLRSLQAKHQWPLGLYFVDSWLEANRLTLLPQQSLIDLKAIATSSPSQDADENKYYNAACVVGGLPAAFAAPDSVKQDDRETSNRLLTMHTNLLTGEELTGPLLAAAIVANVNASPEFRSSYWCTLSGLRRAGLQVQQFAPYFEYAFTATPAVTGALGDASGSASSTLLRRAANIAQLADPDAAYRVLCN